MLPILNRCLHLHSLFFFCIILPYHLFFITILIPCDLFLNFFILISIKLITGFTNVMSSKPKFVILFSTSSISLNLSMEVIFSIMHNIYHHLCIYSFLFFLSFHFLLRPHYLWSYVYMWVCNLEQPEKIKKKYMFEILISHMN